MKQTLPLSTKVHLDKMKILQSDKMKQNKRPAMKSMSASLFCRGLIRSKVGAKSVGHMFWPWYANHVFASPQSSRHCTAFWAMFSGVLLPEYPCKYPTDSSATARPPALFGSEKPWYIEGKGERHHRLDYCETASCRTKATSAAVSQISQTQLLFPLLQAWLRRLALRQYSLHCCLNKTRRGCDREAWPIVLWQRAPATTRARELVALKIPKTASTNNPPMVAGVAEVGSYAPSVKANKRYSRGPFMAAMFLLVFWVLFSGPWWSRLVAKHSSLWLLNVLLAFVWGCWISWLLSAWTDCFGCLHLVQVAVCFGHVVDTLSGSGLVGWCLESVFFADTNTATIFIPHPMSIWE